MLAACPLFCAKGGKAPEAGSVRDRAIYEKEECEWVIFMNAP
jgi:hypothetical protein